MNQEIHTSLTTLFEAKKTPMRQWEDDEFARAVFATEQELEATGLMNPNGELAITGEIIGKLLKRESLAKNLFSRIWDGRGAVEDDVMEMNALDRELSQFAADHHWSEEVRELLDIR